jgi:hypothetical protein
MFSFLLNRGILGKLSERSAFIRWLIEARKLRRELKNGNSPIYPEYPVNPLPRYGFGKPPHQLLYSILDKNREQYAATIKKFASYGEGLSKISIEKPSNPTEPYWNNGFVEGLDPVSLYCFPCIFKSKVCIEIGSGNSTKFLRRGIMEYGLDTKIISIDPHPRAEIDMICDELYRSPLENIDLNVFDRLNECDILMIDNSHQCFQNSDVTVVFLEILPRLRSGVLIYIDDIFLPYDYPPEWKLRYYSEQYLLAVLLLANSSRYEIILPCSFIAKDERKEFMDMVNSFWQQIGSQGVRSHVGNGFWMRVI